MCEHKKNHLMFYKKMELVELIGYFVLSKTWEIGWNFINVYDSKIGVSPLQLQ